MTERQLMDHRIRIARYRWLEREVTDPLAACLIQSIIEELETDLGEACRVPLPQVEPALS